MSKLDLNKIKQNFPEVERFAHRYVVETLTVLAIVIGFFSALMHWFVGTLGWSALFLVIGSVFGLFFSNKIDQVMKKVYSFSIGSNKFYAIGSEVIKILVALFLPFFYFGFLGLLAGTAYQYYIRFARSHRE